MKGTYGQERKAILSFLGAKAVHRVMTQHSVRTNLECLLTFPLLHHLVTSSAGQDGSCVDRVALSCSFHFWEHGKVRHEASVDALLSDWWGFFCSHSCWWLAIMTGCWISLMLSLWLPSMSTLLTWRVTPAGFQMLNQPCVYLGQILPGHSLKPPYHGAKSNLLLSWNLHSEAMTTYHLLVKSFLVGFQE